MVQLDGLRDSRSSDYVVDASGSGITGVEGTGCVGRGLEADSGRLLAESKGWGPTKGENRSGGHQLGMVSAGVVLEAVFVVDEVVLWS